MSAQRQFWAGIALISVIPFLVFCYLHDEDFFGSPEAHFRYLVLYLIVAAIGLAGYLLLRRHSCHLANVRNRLEKALAPAASGTILERNPNDIAAIDNYLSLLIEKLKSSAAPSSREVQQLALAQKIECLSVMATGVAHDFNNALAAVSGNIAIAMRGINDPTAREHARMAEDVTVRTVGLANQLLLYAGRGRFCPQKANLSGVVADYSHELKAILPDSITIEFQLEKNVPAVTFDFEQVRQAVKHLVNNAADAYSGEKGHVVVRTGVMDCDRAYLSTTLLDQAFPPDKYVYVEVTDNGQGIPQELIPRIFDPFFSTKLRGKGLGLAVVLGVARAHFAAITVDSTVGKGSTFRILFQVGRTFADAI